MSIAEDPQSISMPASIAVHSVLAADQSGGSNSGGNVGSGSDSALTATTQSSSHRRRVENPSGSSVLDSQSLNNEHAAREDAKRKRKRDKRLLNEYQLPYGEDIYSDMFDQMDYYEGQHSKSKGKKRSKGSSLSSSAVHSSSVELLSSASDAAASTSTSLHGGSLVENSTTITTTSSSRIIC